MAGAAPNIELVGRAVTFMRENLAEPLAVADIADHVGYSEFHFSRIFSASVRCSPVPYLAALRFQRAKSLLLESEHSVIDICHEVGFSSPGTFTRRFTADVGVSPGAVRRLVDEIAEHALPAHSLAVVAEAGEMCGMLSGEVVLADAARDLLGEEPQIWIGLFESPRPAGRPLSGTLRWGEGGFSIPVPRDAPWLMAAAFRRDADPVDHLAAVRPVVAPAGAPVTGDARRRLVLDFAPPWSPPLLTALPALFDSGR